MKSYCHKKCCVLQALVHNALKRFYIYQNVQHTSFLLQIVPHPGVSHRGGVIPGPQRFGRL